ncbi:MAG: creatininase family protein [Anaerolineaceae bacterium]|jgi:creatinine amidohydrolase|nr:MAG: creatininase family protein [Anaerolineaceae bacterium]
MNNPISYSTMTWFEFADYVKQKPFALLPIGSEEQHGPHMPMSTDSIMAQYFAEEISKQTGFIVLPRISYSTLFSLRRFPGTLYVEEETFVQQLLDLAKALSSHGIEYVYLILGHHGAMNSCKAAERKLITLNSELRFFVLAFPGIKEAIQEHCTSKRWIKDLFHAEEVETSMLLAVRPDLVRMDKAVCEYPEINPFYGSVSDYWNETCKSGVFGDATAATAEKGKKIIEAVVKRSVQLIKDHQASLTNAKLNK